MCLKYRGTGYPSGAASNNSIIDGKSAQLADRNISKILEYLALGHHPLTKMVEESKIDKIFFRDYD